MLPYKDGVFSNGQFSFRIDNTLYVRIYCDAGGASDCNAFYYSPEAGIPEFSCIHCDTGTCLCGVSGCNKGIFYFYSSSDCSTVPYRSGSFISSTISFSTSQIVALKIYCEDGRTSSCTLVNYHPGSTATTSTTSSRTTTSSTSSTSKETCPYECCSDAQNYFDKACDEGFECANHVCSVTSTSSTSIPYNINYSLIASSFIAVCLLVFLLYYVFGIIVMRTTRRRE
jgi:hypothetical protein